MADHMVIRLGKYLRILGYDAAWDTALRTHELIARSNVERRVFLTRNKHLEFQYPHVDRVTVLEATDPVEQLAAVVKEHCLGDELRLFSRCIGCNLELAAVAAKEEIEKVVHPNVYRRQDRFFRCPGCRTVFWHGSHVRNTIEKLGLKGALARAARMR